MNWLSGGNAVQGQESPLPVVFFPGWGFDGRILGLTDPPLPWWSPEEPLLPESSLAALNALLRERQWTKIILVGWSLGARLAFEFASDHPTAIEALVLLSLRRSWPEAELAAIRSGLATDPAAFMADFYRKCFLGYRKAWRDFSARFLEDWLGEIDITTLTGGLSILASSLSPFIDRLDSSGLQSGKIWLLHGDKDIIAPHDDRCQIDGGRHITLKKAGHALFLAPEVQTLSFLNRGGN